jgi:hypothetical protein
VPLTPLLHPGEPGVKLTVSVSFVGPLSAIVIPFVDGDR